MNGKAVAYTSREKILLAHLVKENGVVENKRTDGATLAEKNRAWELIGRTYNSQPEVSTPRAPEQLRKLWNNLKQRKRKETTALRHSMLATGGGPPKKPDLDPVLQIVEEATPNLETSIVCPWDSTAFFEKEQAVARSSLDEGDVSFTTVNVDESDTTTAELSLPSTSQTEALPTFNTPTAKNIQIGNRKTHGVANESKVRVQRVREATKQQQELHDLRRMIAEQELLRVTEEREFLKRKAEYDLRRAADEAELASLKLQKFLRENR